MSETKLVAETRTQFGKGAARKIRRDNKIPAVLYGHGTQPVHITLPGHDTMMALKTANALVDIEIEGQSQLALAKDIQRDPIRPVIEHVVVPVEGLEAGTQVLASQVELPEGAELVTDGETLVVNVTQQITAEALEAELAEAEAEAGIEHEAPEGETELGAESDGTDGEAGEGATSEGSNDGKSSDGS